MKHTILAKAGMSWHVHAAGAGLCIAVSLAGYFALVRPLVQRQADADRQKVELATQNRKMRQLNTSAATLRQQAQAVREALDAGRITLHPADQVNRRVAELALPILRQEFLLREFQAGEPFKYVIVVASRPAVEAPARQAG